MKISLSNKKAEYLHLYPISIGGGGDGGGGYNVSQGYIFVKNFWTANDFKLKFCDF